MSATDEITIAGHAFTVPVRYSEGHTLTAGEASALNQTYHENLRNNFASKVKDLKKNADGTDRELTDADLSDLQAKLDEYAAEYQFGVRSSGGSRTPVDPVAREALNLARAAVRAALKEKGVKADKEQIEALAEGLVAKNATFTEIAKQRVAAAQAAAAISLGDLAA